MIIAALEERGFSLHEVSGASQQHKQLGVWFDGVARVLRHDPRRLWRVHLALRCLLRMSRARSNGPFGAYLLVGAALVVSTPFIGSRLIRVIGGGSSLGLTWRKLRTLAGVVWLSECELGRAFSHVVFCSDATLRRYCVQCTTASFKEVKEATRFRERWRFRTREISHSLSVRHADSVARLGTLSPLGDHSRDDSEKQDDSCLVANFSGAAGFEEISTLYGAWLDSRGWRTRRTSVRASSPKATEIEECVGDIRRLPTARATLLGTPSSKATSSLGKQFT